MQNNPFSRESKHRGNHGPCSLAAKVSLNKGSVTLTMRKTGKRMYVEGTVGTIPGTCMPALYKIVEFLCWATFLKHCLQVAQVPKMRTQEDGWMKVTVRLWQITGDFLLKSSGSLYVPSLPKNLCYKYLWDHHAVL